MAEYRESSGFCLNCQKRVVGRKQEVSHVFWFIATLFSCGLFGIVWIISTFVKATKPFNCSICGMPLQPLSATGTPIGGNFGAASTTKSLSPVLIVSGIIIGLALVGVAIINIGKAVGSNQLQAVPTTRQYISPTNTAPATQLLAAKKPKQNPEQEAQARRQWAQQYEIRKRSDGFANANCTVSGKNNTTLTMRSKAVVIEGAIQTLSDSGYFDEVFEQGFTKLVLMDTVGHTVTLTR